MEIVCCLSAIVGRITGLNGAALYSGKRDMHWGIKNDQAIGFGGAFVCFTYNRIKRPHASCRLRLLAMFNGSGKLGTGKPHSYSFS